MSLPLRLLSFSALQVAAIGSLLVSFMTWSWCGNTLPEERYPNWLVEGSFWLYPMLCAAGCFVLLRRRRSWIAPVCVVTIFAVYIVTIVAAPLIYPWMAFLLHTCTLEANLVVISS